MRAIFLADAHLRRPDDDNYRALLAFLAEQSGRIDRLFLLGDIFEFWIGKSTVTDGYKPLIEALEGLVRGGTRLVYVEGNHDFHLGPVFSERLGCQVLPDGGSYQLDGHSIHIAHGDLANRQERSYLLLRSFFRSAFVRCMIRTLPNALLQGFADRAGHESRKNSTSKRQRWPAREILTPYAAELIEAGHQVVVTGHFHQPFHEEVGDGELIALGDWISQYSYALYEDGHFTLRSYSTDSAEA
jgi:UDP-2,3-diacylglucosamine hydrolase